MKTYRAFLLLLPVFVLNACASKSEFVVVADDVKKLKTETETVRSQSAASYSDVQQVRDEIAQLKGRFDEMDYKNQQTFGRLGLEDSLLVHKLDNIDTRLLRIEQLLGA
ncbi:MAG: tol-pal system protein YbgF, partial [Chlorobium limicola]|nr:tol-pal system protein YbgF [Chlorobium limicola]